MTTSDFCTETNRKNLIHLKLETYQYSHLINQTYTRQEICHFFIPHKIIIDMEKTNLWSFVKYTAKNMQNVYIPRQSSKITDLSRLKTKRCDMDEWLKEPGPDSIHCVLKFPEIPFNIVKSAVLPHLIWILTANGAKVSKEVDKPLWLRENLMYVRGMNSIEQLMIVKKNVETAISLYAENESRSPVKSAQSP
jgi:hypothetical protein